MRNIILWIDGFCFGFSIFVVFCILFYYGKISIETARIVMSIKHICIWLFYLGSIVFLIFVLAQLWKRCKSSFWGLLLGFSFCLFIIFIVKRFPIVYEIIRVYDRTYKDIPDNVEDSVTWVKEPFRILIIDEGALYSLDIPSGRKIKIHSPVDEVDLSPDKDKVVLRYTKNEYYNEYDNDSSFVVLNLRNGIVEYKRFFESGGYVSPKFIDEDRFIIFGSEDYIIDIKNDKLVNAPEEYKKFESKDKLQVYECIDSSIEEKYGLCHFNNKGGIKRGLIVTCNCHLEPQNESQNGNYLIFKGGDKLYLYDYKEKRAGYLSYGEYGMFFK